MIFPAHIRITADGKTKIQTAQNHCRTTAKYAKSDLSAVGMGNAAYLCGLVHDCGKFKNEFAEYIENQSGARGSVNHSFAGFRLIMELFHGAGCSSKEDVSAELFALAVGEHHGLFDCIDENRNSGFLHRMFKNDICYDESKENFMKYCAEEAELKNLFNAAHEEMLEVYKKLAELYKNNNDECSFYLGLLSRLLLSAVIDGDRKDTAEFMMNKKHIETTENNEAYWRKHLQRVEKKLGRVQKAGRLNDARKIISDECRRFAEKPSGVYRLNVPTGSGKTLSSLRYALAHATAWGKDRIIFISPLLSILEQNAQVIREYIDDDNAIVEHHSNVIRTETDGELDIKELAMENWDAPVIITTMVQFLNTVFAGKTTAVRRFQSLCNSVIVIDEVQTVPNKLLSLFTLSINFLSKVCGATILLCSATQPCVEKTEHPILPEPDDVVPYKKQLWEPFKRTIITDAGKLNLSEISEFAISELEKVNSLLVVCNRKDEAEYIFEQVKNNAEVSVHLSASMCIAHRRDILQKLRAALDKKKKCVCISTQVIEAGVDISFERVIRFAAGMDSIIQAAGRCNRNGENENPVPVFVTTCQGENLRNLREIRMGKDATTQLLYEYERAPYKYDSDLSSDKAISRYYSLLYGYMSEKYHDGVIEGKLTLMDLLTGKKYHNDEHCEKFCMTQAFKQAGMRFTVFDNESCDVVVPYGRGEDLIQQLTGQHSEEPQFLARWTAEAKPYTVSVYDYQMRQLGNAVSNCCGISVLSPGFYSNETGLKISSGELGFLEV